MDTREDPGDFSDDARVIDGVAGGEVIGAIDDQVEGVHRVSGDESSFARTHLHQGILRRENLRRDAGFGPSHMRLAEEHLPLQIGALDPIRIHDGDLAYTGCCQVLEDGGTETPGAHHQDVRAHQSRLSLSTHLGHDQMACVPLLGVGVHGRSPAGSADRLSDAPGAAPRVRQ